MLNLKRLVILVLVLFIVISPFLNLKNIPQAFIVLSASMEPAIKSGSLVITKSVDPKLLKIGNIIAFTSPSNPKDTILHRISSLKSATPLRFSTKGDNNNTLDQWDVVSVGVKGRYQFSVPYLGYLVAFIRRPLGFILIICLPALFIIISELFDIKKSIEDEVQRRVKIELKKSSKKIIVLLLLFISLSSTLTVKNIFAQYTSVVTLSNLSFSIGEFIPPQSSINLNENYAQNVHNFDISSTATDNVLVSIIKLYYSFNYGPWQLFPEVINGDNGIFPFTSPFGDGLYSFESLATDSSVNIEDKDFDYLDNQVKVDTIAPTTDLNNNSILGHIYTGQDYLSNGDFENGMTAWVVSSSIGDHHIVNVGVTNNAFILGSDTKSINGTDSLYQIVSIPASASATLSFSYRLFSHDIAEYDHFNVNILNDSGENVIENIFNMGNLGTDLNYYDSDWQVISRDITHLAGRTIKLLFDLTDEGVGETNNSWVFLDNIKISTLDVRVGESSTVNFLATDLGFGVADTTTDYTLNTGENDINFSSMDAIGNIELNHHQSVLVSQSVVLNKIDKNKISLFNNSRDDTIDLNNYFYTIDSGPNIPITGTLPPQHSFDIFLPTDISDSCEIKLYNNTDLIDSTNIFALGTSTWQRASDGLGPWIKINTPPSFNLESRLSVFKITLSVSGLSSTLADMSYTIDYSDSSGQQQIYGQILPNTIDTQGTSSRDLYLGTCSSGGTCIPASGIGSSFVVTFSTLPSKKFIFD